jgi:hypothetical protein
VGVGFMEGLVQVPVVELRAADAKGVLAALIGAGDEAVERDGHVAGGWCHVNHDHRIDEKSSVGTSWRKLGVVRVDGRPGHLVPRGPPAAVFLMRRATSTRTATSQRPERAETATRAGLPDRSPS